MIDAKGLSEIVATLIITLLVLVTVGIVFVGVKAFIQGGSGQVSLNFECNSINLDVISVNEISRGIYDVTIHRSAGGDNNLSGIKVSIIDANGTGSGPMDFGKIMQLDQKTVTLNTVTGKNVTEIDNGTSIEYTPFFTDSTGNEQICPQTNKFNFLG